MARRRAKKPDPGAIEQRIIRSLQSETMTLVLVVRMPPPELRPNSRASWQLKHRLAKQYAEEVGPDMAIQLGKQGWRSGQTYKSAVVGSLHRFPKASGDPDNCVGSLKPILDILEHATKRSKGRYRIGLIENDSNVQILPPSRASYARDAGTIRLTIEVR